MGDHVSECQGDQLNLRQQRLLAGCCFRSRSLVGADVRGASEAHELEAAGLWSRKLARQGT